MNHTVNIAKHLAMGSFRTTGSRPLSPTTIRANPPSIVKMWRWLRNGIFSKMPLKIAARKNTTKGKTLRIIGFVGGLARYTKSLHERIQGVPEKHGPFGQQPSHPLRLRKQFIMSASTLEAALVVFRKHSVLIA